jgi:thiopeptide-type bacteriocin biosynthesis protein
MTRSRQWLQVNVALRRIDGSALASARVVLRQIAARLPEWRHERAVGCFFFMRKPPDLRVRFAGPDPVSRLRPELLGLLRTLRRTGAIEHFYCARYEPETRLFGGTAAIQLIHRHFDSDSCAWIAFDRLSEAGGVTPFAADTLSMAVLNDLFLRVLADRFEVWDTWCNLVTLTGAAATDVDATLRLPIITLQSSMPSAATEQAGILRKYQRANEALSAGLRRLERAERLQTGLRSILPFVAMFHLHRHGYDQSRQAALARAMATAWNPRHGLRGAAVNPTLRTVSSRLAVEDRT